MSIDLTAFGIEELENVIVEAQRLIKAKKKSQRKDARQQLEQVAANFGFTLEELVLGTNSDEASLKVRKPVAIRYRNPNNMQETWTGRGKQPRWLVAAIESGKSLTDFLI